MISGFQSVPGVVESMKVVTVENSERVARYAFEYGRNGSSEYSGIKNKTLLVSCSQKHWTQEGDHHSQGKHHEIVRRLFLGNIETRGRRLSGNKAQRHDY